MSAEPTWERRTDHPIPTKDRGTLMAKQWICRHGKYRSEHWCDDHADHERATGLADDLSQAGMHQVGVTTGVNGTWATYCIECSATAQEWVCPDQCKSVINPAGVPRQLTAAS